jgi:hypothetical protein
MFSKELALKAATDSTFRNHTALGRKVASSTALFDVVCSSNIFLPALVCHGCGEIDTLDVRRLCPVCAELESRADMNYELIEDRYF